MAKIVFPEVLDDATHKAKTGGLLDSKMGTIDRNFKYRMCGEDMSECPGHWGHIGWLDLFFILVRCADYLNEVGLTLLLHIVPGHLVKVKKY